MEKIIKLNSGSYHAKINVSRGANLISLTNSEYNADVLRTPDYDNLDNPYLYGMPILFPVNRISGGRFVFDGRNYSFPINEQSTNCHIHGFLHDKEFEVFDVQDDFLICGYSIKESNGFPHDINVVIEYKADDTGLTQKVRFENLSDRSMPCLLGFHTTFNIPFVKNSNAENILIKCEVNELIERGDDFLPTGNIIKDGQISEELSKGTFRTYKNPVSCHYVADNGMCIEMKDTDSGVTLVYETDKKFKYRLVYNGNGEEFICLEPQNCMVDAINSSLNGKYSEIDVVKPHSEMEYVSKIYLK